VPGGETRGSHAYKEQQEFIVALSGSLDVVLHNGNEELKFSLTVLIMAYIYLKCIGRLLKIFLPTLWR
jgi:hypothetical protein